MMLVRQLPIQCSSAEPTAHESAEQDVPAIDFLAMRLVPPALLERPE